MGQRFGDGVHGTDRDMEGEPGEQEPPSPALTQKQKDSTHDGQQTNEGDQDDSRFERPVREVVDEPHCAGNDEQTAEDRDS